MNSLSIEEAFGNHLVKEGMRSLELSSDDPDFVTAVSIISRAAFTHKAELRVLAGAFTLNELTSLAATYRNSMRDPHYPQFLAKDFEANHEVHAKAFLTPDEALNLLAKLQRLTPGQVFAVALAIEQIQEKWDEGLADYDVEGFTAVGLKPRAD